MAPEVEANYFVSNYHINLKLSNSTNLTMHINGTVISQNRRCKQILDGEYDLRSRAFVQSMAIASREKKQAVNSKKFHQSFKQLTRDMEVD